MKNDATLSLPIALADDGQAAGVPSGEGFFWCEHCHHTVTLGQYEVDAAENAPAGSLVKLKCPRCKHHEVRWRFPSAPRPPKRVPVPVEYDHGLELFAALKAELFRN